MDATTIARDLRRKLDGDPPAPTPAPAPLMLPAGPVRVEVVNRPWRWKMTPVRNAEGLMISALVEPIDPLEVQP